MLVKNQTFKKRLVEFPTNLPMKARANELYDRTGDQITRRRSRLCPRPCRQGARAARTRGRRSGTRVDGRSQFPRRRSVRAGSQPSRTGILSPDGSRRTFSGEPEDIAGDIRTFAAIGVHELIFDCRGQSIAQSIERLQWFATDVIPLVDG